MESLKTFLSDSKGYLQRIVGLADWRSEPSMSLEQVTTQTRAILGNMDQFAVPDIHLANASSQIAAIIGESDSLAVPDITLAEASSQIAAIIGENDDAATPNITLANTKLHVDTTPATGTVHGITGWSVAPVALGSAFAGVATTIARSDHVHPTTGLLTTDSALTTAQLGGTPVALGSSNQQGLSTKAAKSDHVHIYPTAPQVGAMATSHAANAITGFGTSSVALNDSGLNGSSTLVARSDHVHPRTGLMTDLHPANAITSVGGTPVAMAATAAQGTSTTSVARSNHIHPFPTGYGCRAGAGGSTISNSFNIYWTANTAQLWIDSSLIGTIVTSSDYRLKQAVADVPPGSLERVLQLRPVTYRWRDAGLWRDDGITYEGFVAHELQAVVPSAVQGLRDAVNADGVIQPQSLSWAPLVAVLTAAVQELTARVVALEARHL